MNHVRVTIQVFRGSFIVYVELTRLNLALIQIDLWSVTEESIVLRQQVIAC